MNKQVSAAGLSIKIWLIAVLFNTTLGTVTLTCLYGSDMMPMLLWFGTLYGLIVSLPAPVLLYLLFQGCTAYNFTGIKIWRATLMGAFGCGLIAWLLYMNFFRGLIEGDWLFLALAILSGLGAIFTHRRKIQQLATYTETIEQFLL